MLRLPGRESYSTTFHRVGGARTVCTASGLTVKERISMLDDMVLNDENEDEIPATDDEDSLA